MDKKLVEEVAREISGYLNRNVGTRQTFLPLAEQLIPIIKKAVFQEIIQHLEDKLASP